MLADPDTVATRAATVDEPPSAVSPWLVRMGSGRGDVSTYDSIESRFGLEMLSADTIHPEWQECSVGDGDRPGGSGPTMRVAALEPESATVPAADEAEPGRGVRAVPRRWRQDPARGPEPDHQARVPRCPSVSSRDW